MSAGKPGLPGGLGVGADGGTGGDGGHGGDGDRGARGARGPRGRVKGNRNQWLVYLCCFAAIAFSYYSSQSAIHHVDRESAARVAQLKLDTTSREEGARLGDMLLHQFDCTYGLAIQSTLQEAARSNRITAHLALANRHRALARGDRKAAHISLIARRNALGAASRYSHIAASLLPLDPSPTPCD